MYTAIKWIKGVDARMMDDNVYACISNAVIINYYQYIIEKIITHIVASYIEILFILTRAGVPLLHRNIVFLHTNLS